MTSQAPAPLLHNSDESTPMTQTQQQQTHADQGAKSTPDSPDSLGQNAKAQTDMWAPKVGGAIFDITWALLCLSLPMLVLTAIFLGLVYGYEISHHPGAFTDLLGRTSSLQDGSAYYIDYSATRLITVSSWTSTATSFTVTFIMVLASYPLAKAFMKKSQSGVVESLPTAYQLSLIVGLLQGGLGPLWSWVQYCFWKKRSKQTGLLLVALASALAGMALSLAILAADTWLHIATSTVNLDVLSPAASQPGSSYGRGLTLDCYNGTFTPGEQTQCIGISQLPSGIAFPNGSEATRTAMNLSTNNAALTCSLDNKNFAYLAAAQRKASLDFQASTFAMSTTCKPASKLCNLTGSLVCDRSDGCPLGLVQMDQAMTYSCGAWLNGDINTANGSSFSEVPGSSVGAKSNIGFFIQLFRKQGFLDPIGSAAGQEATPNPFFFTFGASAATSDALANDPEAVPNNLFYNKAFIFNCTSTIYELDYTSIDQNVVDGKYTKANATLSNNIAWTLFNAKALTWNVLESAFLSGAQQTSTSQAFADFFAGEFSRSMISMVAAISDGRSNIAEQTRESRLVTQLPKAAFFTLIILNLLFATLGIVLAVIAFASQPRRTRNIQARLSTAGLVAALMEPNSTPRSKQSSSGIESAFAEYYSDSKHHDRHRVMVVDSATDNRVFEKISAEVIVLTDKSTTILPRNHHDQPLSADTSSIRQSSQRARDIYASQIHGPARSISTARPDSSLLVRNSTDNTPVSPLEDTRHF